MCTIIMTNTFIISMMTDRQNAYTTLVMRHRDMLWRMCWRRSGGDPDHCQDMMQEVYIALWEKFDNLRPNTSPGQERAWVKWQARSVLFQMGRRKALPTVSITDSLADNVADENTLARKELIDDLLSVLNPVEQRTMQLYLSGYKGDEIGELTGVSRDAVYQRMHRAVIKMRRALLIIITLLVATTIAVAVVPQWRMFFFGGGEPEGTITDTVDEPSREVPAAPKQSDTATTPRMGEKAHQRKVEKVEKLSDPNYYDIVECPETVSLLPAQNEPTISVEGRWLVITGAEGESVYVYDRHGRLIDSQKASRLCLIELPQYANILYSEYLIKIGNRPMVWLRL